MATVQGLTAAQANAALDGVEGKIRGVRRIAEFRQIRRALLKGQNGVKLSPIDIVMMIELIMKLLDLAKPLIEKVAEIIDAWRKRK